MKSLIKISLFSCILICGICSIQPTYAASPIESITVSDISITPRKDKIIWKYRFINGTLYKRKYNVTQEKWLGSWVKV
ncbi:MAG: hypothetical protein PHD70_02455 [Anaerostipes sp.]|nr:hypothetical protein [Anaerostipes sp.]MDD3745318.1 hypothetical protein [Anaerostipes sp.]